MCAHNLTTIERNRSGGALLVLRAASMMCDTCRPEQVYIVSKMMNFVFKMRKACLFISIFDTPAHRMPENESNVSDIS